jgi:hypothetical protein
MRWIPVVVVWLISISLHAETITAYSSVSGLPSTRERDNGFVTFFMQVNDGAIDTPPFSAHATRRWRGEFTPGHPPSAMLLGTIDGEWSLGPFNRGDGWQVEGDSGWRDYGDARVFFHPLVGSTSFAISVEHNGELVRGNPYELATPPRTGVAFWEDVRDPNIVILTPERGPSMWRIVRLSGQAPAPNPNALVFDELVGGERFTVLLGHWNLDPPVGVFGVPEPSTWLLAVVLIPLAVILRRKRMPARTS